MEMALFNLMSLNHDEETPAQVFELTAAAVQLAEKTGFDATWFAEHHFTSASICPSPLMMVAHCAGLTKRIRLGTGVIVLPLHNPLRAVQEIGFAQTMCDGRLNLGLATGHQAHEFNGYGIDLAARSEMMHEGWDILEQGLTTGRVDHQGKHYSYPAAPICMAPGLPPIYLAGASGSLLERAGRVGATLLISQGVRTAEMALPLKQKAEEGYRAGGFSGRDMPLGLQRYIFVTDDPAEQRRAAEGLLKLARTTLSLRVPVPPRDGVRMHSVPFEGEPSIDWLLENTPIGSVEKVTRILANDIKVLRPTHMSMYCGFSGLQTPAVLAAIERLGRDVLPTLRQSAQAEALAA
ncbi:LLM class flavin-dependent oxidoreductase [Roseococcus pinisoli]|uniref:LLM class flavin-dependent oxidoreductase n=1 Tax=Roseococcus pinisoli TaxID=2835040 RepID=A0ABS5QGC9_9PROT|nr:LLM class flavin-dependent oxidoreductase [Roseococcus pinisoli]MBS7812438.1 LLM class flavin-dependent oxidoreductase [Roseococcus pinisoli]